MKSGNRTSKAPSAGVMVPDAGSRSEKQASRAFADTSASIALAVVSRDGCALHVCSHSRPILRDAVDASAVSAVPAELTGV